MKIKVYRGKKAVGAAGIALQNRLFVPKDGWSLNRYLNRIKKYENPEEYRGVAVSLAFDDSDKPVGVAIQMKDGETQTFVRKSLRRQGIGSKLVDPLRTDKWWCGTGVDGSREFWKNVGCKTGIRGWGWPF